MKHLSIDLETFSSVDLGKQGVYKYVESNDFEILLFAYAVDFGPVMLVDLALGETIPQDIIAALGNPSVTKHAYNASFEMACLSRYGFEIMPNQWQCTLIHGLYLGYPSGLAKLGKALGLASSKQKLASGTALINYFCKPCKPTKSNGGRLRNLPHHDMAKWNDFKAYCVQDVYTEMECLQHLMAHPLPQEVHSDWCLDYSINARGVLVDTELVDGALAIDAEEKDAITDRLQAITGLANPNSRNQLLGWFRESTTLDLETLTKESVDTALKGEVDDLAKEALQLRQQLAKSSISKYEAMHRASCSDGRVRGVLQFYGANRTGRWAGRLIQVQNLPRNYIEPLDGYRSLVKGRHSDVIKFLHGDVSDALSQLIRTAIIAPEGKTLLVSDFSAIEARVLSWLANEHWRLNVFSTTGKIYEASAAMMFGVDVDTIVKGHENYSLRQKGKVAELALGYQGGVNALESMGALKMGLTADELPDIVTRWRTANPRIVDLWHSINESAIYVLTTGIACTVARGIKLSLNTSDFMYGHRYLVITLPSGRSLYYPNPSISMNQFEKPAVHFYTQVGNVWKKDSTYGGKLVENITQAIARDCLALAINRLQAFDIVMHIHDEVVLEVDKKTADIHLEKVNAILSEPIPWADGLRLTAAGFTNDFYMKD